VRHPALSETGHPPAPPSGPLFGGPIGRQEFEVGGSPGKRLRSSSASRKRLKGPLSVQEVEAADRDAAVGSLYLKKTVVGDSPPPELRVTIEASLVRRSDSRSLDWRPSRAGAKVVMVPNTQPPALKDRVATTTHHGWPSV
jgi:hypothetical protein